MDRKKEQGRMREMLSEAIMVLCKASLEYRTEFSIEGLLGITIDNEEIFLINVNEQIKKATDSSRKDDDATSSDIHEESSRQSPKPQFNRKRANASPKPRQKSKQAKLDAEPIIIKEEIYEIDEASNSTGTRDSMNSADVVSSDALINNSQFSSMPPDGRNPFTTHEQSHDLLANMQNWTLASQSQVSNASDAVPSFVDPSLVAPSLGGDPSAGFQGDALMSMEGPVPDTYGSHLSLSADPVNDGAVPGCSSWDTQDGLSTQSESPAMSADVKGEAGIEANSGRTSQHRSSRRNQGYSTGVNMMNNTSLEETWLQNESAQFYDGGISGHFSNLKHQMSLNHSYPTVNSTVQSWANTQDKQVATRNSMFKECPICGKKVKGGKFNLTVHVRTHTGDKPHACSICGWRFASPSNIPQHEKTHYTSRHPFHCEPCGLGFPDPSLLAFHQNKAHSADAAR